MEQMKKETIESFKKIIKITESHNICITSSTDKFFGGWKNIEVGNFLLTMFIGKCHLRYKSIGVDLTVEEWKELVSIVDTKIKEIDNNDIVDILKINER